MITRSSILGLYNHFIYLFDQLTLLQAVAAGPAQDVELTVGTLLSFLGRYLIPSAGHPLPSPTGFSGTKRPSATEPLTLKV